MAIISTRVDDKIKEEAEEIADKIGIPLSTAINIFIKQFLANKGFPFIVTVPRQTEYTPITDVTALDESVKRAVAESYKTTLPHSFTYLDPKTNELVKIEGKE